MQHTIKLRPETADDGAAQKELTDEHVSFCFRCCDDPTTDSWCTVSLLLTQAERDEAILAHRGRMAARHEQKLAFRKGSHAAAVADSSVTI